MVHSLPGSIDFSIVPNPCSRDFEGILRSNASQLLQGLRLADITSRHNDPKFAEYASLRNTVAVLSKLDALNVSWLPMEEGEIVFRRDAVVRAVTDALAVTLGLPNGELLSTPSSKQLATDLILEIHGAFRRQWSEEIYARIASEEEKVDWMPQLPVGLGRKQMMGDLVRHLLVTSDYNAPMLGDIRSGVPTQLRFGLGYLFSIGKAYKFPMPTTSALLRTIRARESFACSTNTTYVKT